MYDDNRPESSAQEPVSESVSAGSGDGTAQNTSDRGFGAFDSGYTPSARIDFEPVFIPPAQPFPPAADVYSPELPSLPELPVTETLSSPPEPEPPHAAPPYGQTPPAAPPASGYASYGYQQPRQIQPAAAETRKRGKGGFVFGLLSGMALMLIGVLIAFFAMGGRMSVVWGTPELPGRQGGQAAQVSPVPTPVATPRPSGGGDAKMDIVPVKPHASSPNGGDSLMVLTNPEIVKKGTPSVVCILVESSSLGYSASGSGIIMAEEDGATYIITNCHVVRGYDVVNVILNTGEEYAATVVGMDQLSDLAVIKVSTTGLQCAEFGDSDALQVGDPVLVIGNPLGLELQGTATQGMISAINRDITVQGRVMTMLQTDASVNHGNSGGPMFNQYGQVVGIISSKIMGNVSGVVEGLGFAIPISIAKPVVDELIAHGYVSGRPTIGIRSYEDITANEARYFHIPRGVRVLIISEECDAYKQGLREDDIITKVNGQEIEGGDQLNLIKNRHGVGDTLTVTVYRAREEFDISFRLMDEGELS